MQLDPVAQLVGIHAMLQGKLRNRDPGLKGGCNQPLLPDRIIPTLPIAQNTHHSWRNRNRVIQCHCVSVSTVSVVDTLDQPDVSEQVQRFARLPPKGNQHGLKHGHHTRAATSEREKMRGLIREFREQFGLR
jgi:hypothetical protein